MSAPLPCPWCKSTQITPCYKDEHELVHFFFAMCDKCGAEGPTIMRDAPSYSYEEEPFKTRGLADAMGKWNARGDSA